MKTNRRKFIQTTGLAAGATIAAPAIVRGQNLNSKLNIAAIGALGKGSSDWGTLKRSGENIVALCDVDSERLKKAVGDHQKVGDGETAPPAPEAFIDFREMLEKMGDKIDGVTVSTPDHCHFPAAMMAVGMGKHVCVQKPMCNTIGEVRALHAAAKKAGVVTQMGNQGRTMEGQRLAKEWIEQGGIGKLNEIKLWTNRPIWPQGDKVNLTPSEVPNGLDWNLWQAQCAVRDYSPSIHPFKWRGWWDYGSGALGDMGCHIMDATFSILGQSIPYQIDVESSPVSDAIAPLWSTITYKFKDVPNYGDINVTWQDGSLADGSPNKPLIPDHMSGDDGSKDAFNKAKSGMLFLGEEGCVFEGEAYCGRPGIYPMDQFQRVKEMMKAGKITKTEKRSPKPNEPQQEWAHCIKTGELPSSNFDYSAPLTEFVLLGNLAVRAGKSVSWNKETMSTGDPAADKFINRPSYREGYPTV